jgi:hypothetical protein
MHPVTGQPIEALLKALGDYELLRIGGAGWHENSMLAP